MLVLIGIFLTRAETSFHGFLAHDAATSAELRCHDWRAGDRLLFFIFRRDRAGEQLTG